ncbi:MAG: replication associated protein [Malazfec virus 8]
MVLKPKPIESSIDKDDDEACQYKDDKSYRGYAITDYELDKEFWEAEWERDKLSYLIVAEEICPETKRKHWQCFLYYRNKSKYSACIKRFKPRHIGYIYSTPLDNAKYCKKGEQSKKEYRKLGVNGPNYGKNVKIILELGDCPMQGQRTDLEEIYERIKKGEIKNDLDLAEANVNTYVQYSKPLKILIEKHRPERTWKTEVFCLHGESGTGKSRFARKKFPGIKAVKLSGDPKNPFILGYSENDCPEHILIEEFNSDSCSQEWWLEATDRYDMPANIKGSTVRWTPKTIVFTSNKHPSTWWDGWTPQIRRRFANQGIIKISVPVNTKPKDLIPEELELVLDEDGNEVSRKLIPRPIEVDEQRVISLEESLTLGIQTKDGYTSTVTHNTSNC